MSFAAESATPELSPDMHLLHQVDFHQPQSLLVAAPSVPEPLQAWARDHHCHLTHLTTEQPLDHSLGRHDFTVVMHYLENLDKPQGMALLGQIRNLYSSHIWVQMQDGVDNWGMNDFIGLGFRRLVHFSTDQPEVEQELTCYGYDLASYNHVRTWNNSKYWANPENWGKYWW